MLSALRHRLVAEPRGQRSHRKVVLDHVGPELCQREEAHAAAVALDDMGWRGDRAVVLDVGDKVVEGGEVWPHWRQ